MLTQEARLEQSHNEKHIFNANCANFANDNNYGIINTYHAQIGGNTKRGGYAGGF